MVSSVIGVFSSDAQKRASLAAGLGKKGSADDITIHNTSFAGNLVTTVEPTLYPKKLEALLFCACLSDYCIVHADGPSPELGEIIVALDLLGKKDGCTTGLMDVSAFTTGTALEGYARAETDDEARMKASSFVPAPRESPTVAVIDHAFDVKGVGSVALGFVRSGAIKVHDRFQAFPSDKSLDIRSIQMQDKDHPESHSSDRFGISFKGMKAEELDRGMVLAPECRIAKDFDATLEVTKFCRRPVENGEVMHFAAGLQMTSGKLSCAEPVAGGKSAKVKVQLDREIALPANETVLACRLNEKGLRIVASVKPAAQ